MDRIQRNNAGLTWVGGCAIGCGVATVLLILVIILGMYGVKYGMERGKEEVVAEASRQVADAREQNQISADEEAVLNESISLVARPETTAMAAFMLPQLFEQLKKADGEQRAEILQAVRDYNQFLREHPQAPMTDLFEFIGKHPTLSKVINEGEWKYERRIPQDNTPPQPAPATESEAPGQLNQPPQ